MTPSQGSTQYRLLPAAICIYLALCAAVVYFQYRYMTDYQFQAMGDMAVYAAELAENTLDLTSQELRELEGLTFAQAMDHPATRRLQKMFVSAGPSDDVKYAYVIRAVPQDQVRYWVSEEDTDFYGLPTGTPLDHMWLLDVIVNENEQVHVDSVEDYYRDKNRYTNAQSQIRNLYQARQSGSVLWKDEWGVQIAGLAPLYTTEGEYAGLIGVDIYSSSFYDYRNRVLGTFIALLLLPTVLLTAVYLSLHLRYRRRMTGLAYEDQLTGVFNRRYYDEHAQAMLERARQAGAAFTLLLGDIDNFKAFNDLHGHLEGDLVLQEIAALLRREVPEEGFLARYGGEEFTLVCQNADPDGLCALLCRRVAEQSRFHVTLSLGAVSRVPAPEDTLEDLLAQADRALYQAKAAGKNTYAVYRD